MRTLSQAYLDAINTPSDISEHLETIRTFASGFQHATELGTRGGVSTWALLAARVPRIACYDIMPVDLSEHISIAAENRIALSVYRADVLAIDLHDDTDLLLIDTWHTYTQLSAELHLHARRVRRYGHIIMHDTTTYGETDEPIYAHASEHAKRWARRWPTRGLRAAIRDFCDYHSGWRVVLEHQHCNGLTILQRS